MCSDSELIFTVPDAEAYRQFGFVPSAPASQGMLLPRRQPA
jgi:hypothetical protein